MAVPALGTKVSPASGMIGDCALMAGDLSNVSGAGLTDAQWTIKINDAYYWWVTEFEKRTQAKTLVASYGSGIYSKISETTVTDPEILEVSIPLTGATTGNRILEWMPWTQLRALQARTNVELGAIAVTYPQFYALQKQSGNSLRWLVALWPDVTSALQINCRVRVHPTALSASADVPDLDDFSVRCVERIAAAWGAEDLGQPPEKVDRILRSLPQQVRAQLMSNADVPDPQRRREPVSR